jgi:hypothetical protein
MPCPTMTWPNRFSQAAAALNLPEILRQGGRAALAQAVGGRSRGFLRHRAVKTTRPPTRSSLSGVAPGGRDPNTLRQIEQLAQAAGQGAAARQLPSLCNLLAIGNQDEML